MSEDPTGEIENTPSHDANAESSTAPEAEVKPQAETEAGATETPEEPKKVNKVQERINQLTREKYEGRQANEKHEKEKQELRAELAAIKSTISNHVDPDTIVAPNEDDFDTHAEYHTANAKYYADVSANAANERITASNASNAEVVKQDQRQKELEAKKTVFEKKLESIRGNFEDFEDVAYGNTQFMDLDLAEQIFDLDKGPEVAYHLGSHLDEAARIFALTPVQRARELTKLEFQVEALAPKKVSDAPDPLNPLGNNEKVDVNGKDGENLSTDEWQAWRNQQVHG